MEPDKRITKFRFNIDRGGTFTDIYCEYYPEGKFKTDSKCIVYKLLSQDPFNYDDAPSEGIRRLISQVTGLEIKKDEKIPTKYIDSIRMGTTIATNALLERKGEPCALLITEGFKDLLEIGNQTRPHIFDLKIERHQKIYDCVYEVNERVRIIRDFSKEENSQNLHKGVTGEYVEILKKLQEDEVRGYLKEISEKGIKSIAVAFAHSYTFREHETMVKKIAKEMNIFDNISLSSEIMPMIKFYPRASTSVVDAYLTPAIYKYVERFLSYFDEKINVLFMQSDGGLTNHETFFGSKAIISGPAGGVVGYSLTTSNELKNQAIIGLDMGGTSTDVSRYDNGWEHVFENHISGIAINSPQIDVNTVAAGGGSRLFLKNGMFVVGPDSAGADPGPLCYKKNGYLAITDANLILGRLIPRHFPKIFGKKADEPLSYDLSYEGMKSLTEKMNIELKLSMTVEEVAYGFLKVANETMCRPIRSLTQARGYDPKDHVLSIFGGAGGQHACALAKLLNMSKVYIHKYAGILSAYGLSKAETVEELQEPVNQILESCDNKSLWQNIQYIFKTLEEKGREKIKFFDTADLEYKYMKYLLLRYEGNDYNIVVKEPVILDESSNLYEKYVKDFETAFRREYGFLLEKREIIIDYARVRVILSPKDLNENYDKHEEISYKSIEPDEICETYFEINESLQKMKTSVYFWEKLLPGVSINGPALVQSGNSTVVIEPGCLAKVSILGNLIIEINNVSPRNYSLEEDIVKDPLELSLFANRFMSIAEQMGRHLQRTSVSTNIKERLDFSCALFDAEGNLVANAPHLPVHLGAMQEVVKHQINYLGQNWKEGEVILCNHPQAGGSHLPDMTVITPVYHSGKLIFFVGNRGHHSDIGGMTPGSMPPFSKNLIEEGAAIYSFKLVENSVFQEEKVVKIFRDDLISMNVHPSRNLRDNISDLKAQVAANNKGIELIIELCEKYGIKKISAYMKFIQEAAENSVRNMLDKFGEKIGIKEGEDGEVSAEDYMDDGSVIRLRIKISRKNKSAVFNFNGTSPQVYGNINTPKSVTYSAVIYCLRCLIDSEIPLNQGCLAPIEILIPENSLLWPSESCAVVGGNVTTSQRITDIVLSAFKACASSQGDMNNFTFGNQSLGYYETIGGGSGAGPSWHGKSGVQVHMTNTRITDIEVIERRYPVMVLRFSLRPNSGGLGKFIGGDGIIRIFKFLEKLNVSILSERRVFAPPGIEGGEPGEKGVNLYVKNDGKTFNIGSKNSIQVENGDVIVIMTPGGGGYGKKGINLEKERKDLCHVSHNKFGIGSLGNYFNNQYSN